MNEQLTREIFENALATQEPLFGKFFLSKFLGLEIRFEQDCSMVTFNVQDFMLNPQGSLHGGVIAMVTDISMGHLIHHITGRGGATIEMKIQYMRAVKAGRVTCCGRFLKQGRTISAMESRMTDGEGKLLALATATWAMPKS